tara:strand:+ start:1478 stop:1957 length:480 start_codon:yes stop_codon:yes gene_type:complete
MSNFAELQCFNKLILQKMQRMQKKIEKLETTNLYLSNEKKEYNSLMECVDMDDVEICWECDLWHERCYMYEIGDTNVCKECYDEKNYFECDNCGENYCEDEMKKMKGHYDSENQICNRCYKGYIILDNDNDINDGDVINDMVGDKNKVMEELLKKFKTN